MYTTWAQNYNYVKHFAEYSWNHAPYIIHTPFWGIEPNRKLSFDVQITGDDMDSGWELVTAKLYYRTNSSDNFISKDLNLVNNNANLEIDLKSDNTYLEYYIEATDNRGWSKRNPLESNKYYILGSPTNVQDENSNNELLVSPNPAEEYIEITFESINPNHSLSINPTLKRGVDEQSEIYIYNTLGEEVLTESIHPMTSSHRLNIESLPKGMYYVKAGNRMVKFMKM
jgi:hypothetical protein